MKKVKMIATLILALAFLMPTVACTTNGDIHPPFIENDSASSSSTENESSSPSSEYLEENLNSSISTPPTNNSTSSNSSVPVTPSTPSNPTPTPTPEYAQYIKCTGDNVNIRSGAGTNYSILGSAKANTMYAVIGKTGSWYKTYYRNQIAYIYAEYASVFKLEKTSNSQTEKVISEGYKLLGVPYVYGAIRLHNGKGKLLAGFSAQKFDCSSLIQYIFYQGTGAILDVNTRTQVKQGKSVAKKDLQRGDCIYFTNEERQYNTGIERIGHVALYLGNDYILHTASDYARIEKMSAKRWSFYVEARRFI